MWTSVDEVMVQLKYHFAFVSTGNHHLWMDNVVTIQIIFPLVKGPTSICKTRAYFGGRLWFQLLLWSSYGNSFE